MWPHPGLSKEGSVLCGETWVGLVAELGAPAVSQAADGDGGPGPKGQRWRW